MKNVMDQVEQHGGYNQPGLGVKKDQGKPQYHLIPFDLLEGEQRVWAIGAKKYDINQWRKGMPITQPFNALLRHLFAFMRGEDLDPETGESHLDHAQCCLRMMQNTMRYHPQLDDRPKWSPPKWEVVEPELKGEEKYGADDWQKHDASRYSQEMVDAAYDGPTWRGKPVLDPAPLTAMEERMRKERIRANTAADKPTNGWIPYHGQGQPVDNDVKVQVRLRKGTESAGELTAGAWSWRYGSEPHDGDIVAYRLVPYLAEGV